MGDSMMLLASAEGASSGCCSEFSVDAWLVEFVVEPEELLWCGWVDTGAVCDGFVEPVWDEPAGVTAAASNNLCEVSTET